MTSFIKFLKNTSAKAPVCNATNSDSSRDRNDKENDESCSDEENGLADSSSKPNSRKDTMFEGIAQRETRMVNCSKSTVISVVSLLAAAAGLFSYIFLGNQEQANYQTSFDTVVREISGTLDARSHTIMSNLEMVSVSLTTQATLASMEWPYVIFPDYQVQGILSNKITGASTLAIHPFVKHQDRVQYENFTVNHQKWLERAHEYNELVSPHLYVNNRGQDSGLDEMIHSSWNETGITPYIWMYDEDLERVPDHQHDLYFPIWQLAPAEDYAPTTTNLNFAKMASFYSVVDAMIKTDRPALTAAGSGDYLAENYNDLVEFGPAGTPRSYVLQPVYDSLLEDRQMVAFLSAYIGWEKFLQGSLPESDTQPVYIVVHGTCGNQTMTFEVSGGQDGVVFLGMSDLHNPIFDNMVQTLVVDQIGGPSSTATDAAQDGVCRYAASVYPSQSWADQYFSDSPIVFAVLVITCFLITTILFAIYDFSVQLRQRKVMETAAKTNAIVTSLFPSNVRDRLMQELNPAKEEGKMMQPSVKANPKGGSALLNAGTNKYGSPLNLGAQNLDLSSKDVVVTSESIFGSKPIADLFPNTTVMFADMAGFTAWASTRDPTQVFTLLETVFHAFDAIAKRRKIFKVETVGDCYVAVSGLPIARKDHALAMARFASDCLDHFNTLTHRLEKSLGPDTADLTLRIGLHSGPVTAGVLRGEKGRFQLFGDTVNVASRMETTGEPNKIQMSTETADLLIEAGKSKWVVPRQDVVFAKGKGELRTFWFRMTASSSGSVRSLSIGDDDFDQGSSGEYECSTSEASHHLSVQTNDMSKTKRLIDYNVDILAKLLHQIVIRRASHPSKMTTRNQRKNLKAPEGLVLDEVKDIVDLPQFDANTFKKQIDPDSISISPRVHAQLVLFVAKIAELYRPNPFHSFEHASHVTQSVTKLLGRITNPVDIHDRSGSQHKVAAQFHDHTFGISSDPLTQLAVVLSALIHDADHPGVSNDVLATENDPMAVKYNKKSVAEQNSVELSWAILMQPGFDDLRACIYCNEEEFARFRQIVVNIVLATDIMDKELGALRRSRWEKAFENEDARSGKGRSSFLGSPSSADGDDPHTNANRKATIVLEHLIQASDVAHTMQHWHVYRKWNERLFHEMYKAFLDGRLDKNPSVAWYQGEIGFFDFYIIPLAKKLETCGVFGVSSDEFLNYAQQNRSEWVSKGEQIVKAYLANYQQKDETA